jgi:hypothetical protein
MNEVIKVINYIKLNSLWTRIFASLCEAMNSNHKVRWLSKEKVLEGAIFLQVEIVSFFGTEDTDRINFLHDDIWWLEVSFLNDLFNKLNILNLILHDGAEENIITITGKLKAFEEKLEFWIKKSKDLKFNFLPSVNVSTIKNKISREIQDLLSSFSKNFPSLNSKQDKWVNWLGDQSLCKLR